MRIGAMFVALTCLAAPAAAETVASAAAQETRSYKGRPVADVLRELQVDGVRLIFRACW